MDDARAMARRIVADLDESQLDVFDSTVDACAKDPVRSYRDRETKGGALAGDMGRLMSDLTPIAIYLAQHILSAFADAATDDAGKGIWQRVRRAAGRRAPAPATSPAPATPDRNEVVTIVVVRARAEFGLKDDVDITALTAAALKAAGLTTG